MKSKYDKAIEQFKLVMKSKEDATFLKQVISVHLDGIEERVEELEGMCRQLEDLVRQHVERGPLDGAFEQECQEALDAFKTLGIAS